MDSGSAFDGVLDGVNEIKTDQSRKGSRIKGVVVAAGVTIVAVVAIGAELLVLAPSLSNDVDLSKHWSEVVNGTPYFYEDKIYYEVGLSYGGNFKQVGEVGAIARMDLDGKNREVLVEGLESNGYFSSSNVVFVSVVDDNLYYLKSQNWDRNALYAIDLSPEGEYEQRVVVDNMESRMTASSIKDGWGYYYSGNSMMRVELLSGKKERVGTDSIDSVSSWNGEVYYLYSGSLWELGSKTSIWNFDGDFLYGPPGGLVVRDGVAYFILDNRVVKIDVENGELLDEIVFDKGIGKNKAMWTNESFYAADDERVVYGLLTGSGRTATMKLLTLDIKQFKVSEVTTLMSLGDTEMLDMGMSGERYVVINNIYGRGDRNVIVDLQSGSYERFDDLEIFVHSGDGDIYTVKRTVGEDRAYRYEVERSNPGDLMGEISIRGDLT
ncbi:hypothetical protein FWF89_03070 [Candidatus Saccharibacteria bacterium]|nr:hypothetical protein [Candidatus Saccharibacteria bacterium]